MTGARLQSVRATHRVPVATRPVRAVGRPCHATHSAPLPFLGDFHMSKKPVRVAVTGAAGQIGYALLFRKIGRAHV